MNVAFIPDNKSFSKDGVAEAGPCTCICTPDMDVYARCMEMGLDVRHLGMCQPRDAAHARFIKAQAVCDDIIKETILHGYPDEAGLAKAARNALYFLFLHICNIVESLDVFFSSESVSLVFAQKSGTHVSFWDDAGENPSLFNALLEVICRMRQQQFAVLPDAGIDEIQRPDETTCSAPADSLEFPDNVDILFVSEGLSRTEHRPLYEVVPSDFDCFVLSDHSTSCAHPGISLRQLRSLAFNAYDDPDGHGSLSADSVKRVLDAPPWKDELFIRTMLQLPHIWEKLDVLLKSLRRERDLAKSTLEALQPGICVLGYDAFPGVRIWGDACRSQHIPCLSVDHVGVSSRYSAMRNRDVCNDIAVWGRYDALCQRHYRDYSAGIYTTGRLPIGRKYVLGEVEEKVNLLIITSKMVRGALCEWWVDARTYVESWKELTECIKRNASWHAYIKKHPRYDHNEFYVWITGGHDRIQVLQEDTAPPVHAAVLMQTPSTAAIDLMQAGIPVIYLRHARSEGLVSPLESNLLTVCDCVEDMEAAIQNVTQNKSAREAVINNQRRFLQRALSADGKDAAARVMRVLDDKMQSDVDSVTYSVFGCIMAHLNDLTRVARGTLEPEVMSRRFRQMNERRGADEQNRIKGRDYTPALGASIMRVMIHKMIWRDVSRLPRTLKSVFEIWPDDLRPEWSTYAEYMAYAYNYRARHAGRGIRKLMQKTHALAWYVSRGMPRPLKRTGDT